jgi:hypothetical protein
MKINVKIQTLPSQATFGRVLLLPCGRRFRESLLVCANNEREIDNENFARTNSPRRRVRWCPQALMPSVDSPDPICVVPCHLSRR